MIQESTCLDQERSSIHVTIENSLMKNRVPIPLDKIEDMRRREKARLCLIHSVNIRAFGE